MKMISLHCCFLCNCYYGCFRIILQPCQITSDFSPTKLILGLRVYFEILHGIPVQELVVVL